MVRNIKTKGVAFNLDDPDQKELYEFAMERTNFSSYVKRLIQRDREGGHIVNGLIVEEQAEELITDDVISGML